MQATSREEWFYIGHYGQLGPLTRDQIDELVSGGVVLRDTYIWRTGMSDWLHADRIPELRPAFAVADPFAAPPPPPGSHSHPPTAMVGSNSAMPTMGGWRNDELVRANPAYPAFGTVKSDRSRVLAGILNLFLPGVGRIYLGHAAHGVLQLVLSFCGIGWVWSFVDGIVILAGGVKYDGYGRVLAD